VTNPRAPACRHAEGVHPARRQARQARPPGRRARIANRWRNPTPLGLRARALRPTNRREAMPRYRRFALCPLTDATSSDNCSRKGRAPRGPHHLPPDRKGEAPVAPCPVRSPGGASRRARGVQLHCRLRIGARRPWTACEARRPRGGPTRPDRHGSIGLQLHGRAPYESRRRWPLHSGCTPAAPPLPAHPRHRTGQRAATISLFRLSQDFSSPVNHRLTRHESPDTRTMASHFPARFQPASGCPVPYQM